MEVFYISDYGVFWHCSEERQYHCQYGGSSWALEFETLLEYMKRWKRKIVGWRIWISIEERQLSRNWTPWTTKAPSNAPIEFVLSTLSYLQTIGSLDLSSSLSFQCLMVPCFYIVVTISMSFWWRIWLLEINIFPFWQHSLTRAQ